MAGTQGGVAALVRSAEAVAVRLAVVAVRLGVVAAIHLGAAEVVRLAAEVDLVVAVAVVAVVVDSSPDSSGKTGLVNCYGTWTAAY